MSLSDILSFGVEKWLQKENVNRLDSRNTTTDEYSTDIGNGRQLVAAASSGYGSDCCPPVVDPYTWLALIAGIALATYFLRIAITTSTKLTGRRRKRRDLEIVEHVTLGLEEFEDKIDRLEQTEEEKGKNEEGWLQTIFKEFVRVKEEVGQEIQEEEKRLENEVGSKDAQDDDDLEDIEPPLLDPLWDSGLEKIHSSVLDEHGNKTRSGLRERVKREADRNATVSNTVEDGEAGEDDYGVEGVERCKLVVWRCLSGVLEGGVKYIDKPGGLMALVKKAMYKIAFHGAMSNVWNSLMTIPEARKLTKCFKKHDECVTFEMIAKEAHSDLGGKKARVMINPDYVESLDQTDGSEMYDEEPDPALFE